MMHIRNIAESALSLCGVVAREGQLLVIGDKPLVCRDDDGHFHRCENAIEWSIHSAGVVLRHGLVSARGRVTEFGHDKNFSGQRVLPFAGSWQSPSESLYQEYRWRAWNARG